MTDLAAAKMGTKRVFPLLMSMSLPPVLSMLIQSLYNIVDSMFVAQVSDEAYQRLASLEITLAVVEIPLTGVSVPLTVTLPATLAEGATGLVDGAFAALRNIVGAPTYLERWE